MTLKLITSILTHPAVNTSESSVPILGTGTIQKPQEAGLGFNRNMSKASKYSHNCLLCIIDVTLNCQCVVCTHHPPIMLQHTLFSCTSYKINRIYIVFGCTDAIYCRYKPCIIGGLEFSYLV